MLCNQSCCQTAMASSSLHRIYTSTCIKKKIKRYGTSGFLPVLLKLERSGAWKVLTKEDHVTSLHFPWSDYHLECFRGFLPRLRILPFLLRNSGTVMAQQGDHPTPSATNQQRILCTFLKRTSELCAVTGHRSQFLLLFRLGLFWELFGKQMSIFNW